MRLKLTHLLLTCVMCAPSVALASSIPIVSISNSNPSPSGLGVASTYYLQASWSQSESYSNVDVSAWISGGSIQVPGTAYLTSSSLATPLKASFNFQSFVLTDQLLFSGLTLPAGTYYLTLATTSNYGVTWVDSWENGGVVTTTLSPGVTLGPVRFTEPGDQNPADPPASFFVPVSPSSDELFFSVISRSTVPEPSSILLMGTASLSFIFRLRKR